MPGALTEANANPQAAETCFTFKARPISKAVMESAGDLGVPRVQKKEATKVKEFKLSGTRARTPKDATVDEQPLFSSFGGVPPVPTARSRPNSARNTVPLSSVSVPTVAAAPGVNERISKLAVPPARWSTKDPDASGSQNERPLYSSFGGVPPVPKSRPNSARGAKKPTAPKLPAKAKYTDEEACSAEQAAKDADLAVPDTAASVQAPIEVPSTLAPALSAPQEEGSDRKVADAQAVDVQEAAASSTPTPLTPAVAAAVPDEQSSFSSQTLVFAVRELRAQSPGISNKALIARLKEAHPEWSIGAKEVREAVRQLDSMCDSRPEPAAAATPEVHIKAAETATPPTHEF